MSEYPFPEGGVASVTLRNGTDISAWFLDRGQGVDSIELRVNGFRWQTITAHQLWLSNGQ